MSVADGGFGMMIAQSGSEEQTRRYLPALARDERNGAFLLSEPHAASDTAAFRTSARREVSHYVLNDSKQFISNGSGARFDVVLSVSARNLKKHGLSLLVDPSESGYNIAWVESKYGQNTVHIAQIQLGECRVSLDNLLGRNGDGYYQTMGYCSVVAMQLPPKKSV